MTRPPTTLERLLDRALRHTEDATKYASGVETPQGVQDALWDARHALGCALDVLQDQAAVSGASTDVAEPDTPATCCDGTGWTGNPRERCVEHYEPNYIGLNGSGL